MTNPHRTHLSLLTINISSKKKEKERNRNLSLTNCLIRQNWSGFLRLLRNRIKYCCFTFLPKVITDNNLPLLSDARENYETTTQCHPIRFRSLHGDQNAHHCSCGTGAGSGEQSPRGRVSPGTQQSRVGKEGATPLQGAQTITQRRQPLH